MTISNEPNNHLQPGAKIAGYTLGKIVPLTTINATLFHLTHDRTGAQHVHISRDDRENAFGVTFKTVPSDSTGVAHILEHTVLCGSVNYPVRDPFFSMIKRSLSTFMNAFTSSDWTMYPFATQNSKDFYHLMDVYLDAAFFPLLEELSFKQEGHRLEIESEEGDHRLVYKGVVYNEMKGAMSSADQVMARSMLKALFPDTTYGNNSGGDPAEIPKLTHEQLKAFHARHYHPSNAFFYTYGNLPLKDHLTFIDGKVLQRFDRIDPHTQVEAQPRWKAPRTARFTYPLAPGEDPQRKSQASLAWLACDIRDTFEVLVLAVLEQIMLGNAGSPLRKALMDSGLGSALSDASGFDADNRDTLFACGLKEIREEDAPQVEALVLDVLKRLADGGVERELVDSAIHQIEFHRREITNTPYPYGLRLLLIIIGSWLHGGNPERILELDDDMQRLRREVLQDDFLKGRIRRYFLDNPHRVRMTLAPDQQKSQNEESALRRELDARLKTLNDQERRRIEEDALRLKQLQESQEDISCLPTLALTDIPPEVQTSKPDTVAADLPVWCFTQPTSGIFYFKGVAAAADVQKDLLPWIPFYCYAFNQIGSRRSDYTTIARRIDAVTGSFRLTAQARMLFKQPGTCMPLLTLNTKCLTRNLNDTLALVEELIADVDFANTARLKQLLAEYQAGLQKMIVQNGHRLAISLSSRYFTPANALNEMWSGVQQVQYISSYVKNLDDQALQQLGIHMAAITQAVFKPENFLIAAIGDDQQVDAALSGIRSSRILSAFRRRSADPDLNPLSLQTEAMLPYEGWSTSSAVAFVAQTVETVPLAHPDAPALAVLSKMLRSLYLHREIREKGGAYGGYALYNPENGLFSLASYRDPHIARTLQVYSQVPEFIERGEISDEDLKEAVLQMCSEIDKPDPPGPAARKAFSRMIIGLTDETRLTFKKQLLALTRDRVLEAARTHLKGLNEKAGTAVIAGGEQLEEANRHLRRPLKLDKI